MRIVDEAQETTSDMPLGAALVLYGVLCVPAYLWLEGPVGTAGTVDASVTIAGLALGSILFVPMFRAAFKRRYDTGMTSRLQIDDD